MLGNNEKYLIHNKLQKSKKVFNNALSGTYASKSTILYNPSAHYTLTSVTRSIVGIGNAVTESMIAGNKLFRTYDITINYIVSIISNIDHDKLNDVITNFNIHIPTVNECMDMLLKSTKYYWRSKTKIDDLRKFVSKLNSEMRVALMYTNDLYHFRKYNDKLMREIISNINTKHKDILDNDKDRLAVLENTEDFIMNLVSHICMDVVKGKIIKDVIKVPNSEELNILSSTVVNIERLLDYYKPLFNVFFRTDNLPIGIGFMPNMVREVILVSDTDSTIATYDSWAEWYFGSVKFDESAVGLAAILVTINAQTVTHSIKLFGANLGSDSEYYNVLEMKNEFFYTNFEVSNVAKTYFAEIIIQEGNVFKKPDEELKGVHLINSTAPKYYRDKTAEIRQEIQHKITSKEPINVRHYIDKIVELEQDIISKILRGDTDILKSDKIKEENSYKLERDKSPYLHHLLWNTVFKEYGEMPEPPYMCVKVPTIIDRGNRMMKWLDNHDNKEWATRYKSFLKKYNKTHIGIYKIPFIKAATEGLPNEILSIIDTRKVVLDILKPLYIIMETLGCYKKEDIIYSDLGYTEIKNS